MARTAQAKKTSEERCREAFKLKFNATAMGSDGLPLTGVELLHVKWGWDVCWRYLQEHAVQEFIES